MILARLLRPLAAVLFVVSLVAPPSAKAQTLPGIFPQFFVFGDSLVDTGNVWLTSRALKMKPAPPPSTSPNFTYFEGRFSNGRVMPEYLWQRVSGAAPGSSRALQPYIASPFIGSTSAVNFAFGGTGTPMLDQTPGGMYAPGLKGQVELFRLALRGRAPSAGALYLIATGANDYRVDQYNVPLQPDVVVNNIAFALRRLYQLGARTLLVAGLPDLGRLPFADPAASGLTVAHNALLRAEIVTLSAQMPDARFIFVDINDAFDLLPPEMNLTIPALAVYGSQLPTPDPGLMTCLFTAPSTCRNVPMEVGAGFAFWDIVHPTTAAHQVLGALLFEHLP